MHTYSHECEIFSVAIAPCAHVETIKIKVCSCIFVIRQGTSYSTHPARIIFTLISNVKACLKFYPVVMFPSDLYIFHLTASAGLVCCSNSTVCLERSSNSRDSQNQ